MFLICGTKKKCFRVCFCVLFNNNNKKYPYQKSNTCANGRITLVCLIVFREWVSNFYVTPGEQFFRHIMTRTSYILMRWWCLLCTRSTDQHPYTHTHILFLHFFLLVYYFQLYYMIKLYLSCFLVHSQYNVIIIVYIGEDSISW